MTAYHGLRAFGLFIIWSVCLSLCLCSFHSEGEVAKTSEKAERLGECYHQAQVPAVSSAPLLFRVVVCLPAWKLVVSQLQFLLFVDLVLWYCKRVQSCAQFWVDHPPQTCSHAFLHSLDCTSLEADHGNVCSVLIGLQVGREQQERSLGTGE